MEEGKVQIHNKVYLTVAYRINDFRKAYAGYSVITKIIENTDDRVIMSAAIINDKQVVIATGHAEEYRNSSQINKTSALENCETSAIGRALACFGVGGTEFASANEVLNAIAQQEVAYTPQQKKQFDTIRDPLDFWLFLQSVSDEAKLALYSSFKPGQITAQKKIVRDLETRGSALFAELKQAMIDHIEQGDLAGLHEIGQELGTGKQLAFSQLSHEQQNKARELSI